MQNFFERIERKQARDRMNEACVEIERESFSQEHTNAAIGLLESLSIDGGLYANVNLAVIHEQAYQERKRGQFENPYGCES